jgi:hypothetical protein
MVSRAICKTCREYMAVPRKRKDKAMRDVWRCRLGKDGSWYPFADDRYSKVLWEEETPAKGCPKLMEHALAYSMSRG